MGYDGGDTGLREGQGEMEQGEGKEEGGIGQKGSEIETESQRV